MKIFLKKVNKLNGGFTLVETLVALSIFTVSILSLMVILGQGISNTNYAKTKIIASYLAEEGVEYIRNVRDTYALYPECSTGPAWNNFRNKLQSNQCHNANGCDFDEQALDYGNSLCPITSLVMDRCNEPGGLCRELLYNSLNGKYNYTTGTNSGYIRKIKMDSVTGTTDEFKITSTVFWKQGSGSYSISFSDNLLNWIEQ